ncbi:MAG: hypothetical protein SV760_07180 [Halobacteria archaeon]|nr:hypothetical protein [Halobacteria archaeon]
MPSDQSSLMYGRDSEKTRLFLKVSIAIFFTVITIYGIMAWMVWGVPSPSFITNLLYLSFTMIALTSAANAYLNDGLLVSAVISISPVFAFTVIGFFLAFFGIEFNTQTPFFVVLIIATVYSLAVGLGGFIAGIGVRKLTGVEAETSPTSSESTDDTVGGDAGTDSSVSIDSPDPSRDSGSSGSSAEATDETTGVDDVSSADGGGSSTGREDAQQSNED